MSRRCDTPLHISAAIVAVTMVSAAAAPEVTLRKPDVVLPVQEMSTSVKRTLREFEEAPVVAIVYVDGKREAIATTFEGEELRERSGRLRSYFSHVGSITQLVRLNGRDPDDPDLAGGIEIEQVERERDGIRLELGHTYLLLLRRSTRWHWTSECSRGCVRLPAPFELTARQGGYELRDGRLRVLLRRGPLDAFDGKPLADLVAAIAVPSR